MKHKNLISLRSGCGIVGRVVASYTRGPEVRIPSMATFVELGLPGVAGVARDDSNEVFLSVAPSQDVFLLPHIP